MPLTGGASAYSYRAEWIRVMKEKCARNRRDKRAEDDETGRSSCRASAAVMGFRDTLFQSR